MSRSTSIVCGSSIPLLLLLAIAVSADVSDVYRYNRPTVEQQQQQPQQLNRQRAYPAAGYRPNRVFNLPIDQPHHQRASQSQSQPNRFYIPPQSYSDDQAQQQQQQQPITPQRTYLSPVADRPSEAIAPTQNVPQRTYLSPAATAQQAARLTANREEQEDVEDFAATEIEVNIDEQKTSKTTAVDNQQLASAAPAYAAALAYYPLAYYHVQPAAAYTAATSYFGQLQATPLIAATAAYAIAPTAAVAATPVIAGAQSTQQQQQQNAKLTAQRTTTKQKLSAPARQRAW